MKIDSYYRQATPTEIAYYQDSLYPLQDAVFATATTYGQNLYLTGGTALARYYFQHRLSEDLDFFTTTNDLKLIANDLRLRLIDQGYRVEVEKLDVYFARLYLFYAHPRAHPSQGEMTLKIEFAKEFNLVDPLVETTQGIYINSLEDIGANKITAFEDRAAIKDIVDLYYITQRLPFPQLFTLAERKRVPVAYEELLALNTTGITGQALLVKPIDTDSLTAFLTTLKTETEAEVKKKVKERATNLDGLVRRLLWEFPAEQRTINPFSIAVLQQRLQTLPLPDRQALAQRLQSAKYA